MKLLIISHTPHYLSGDQIVGWGSTIREIDQLTQVFEQVVHIAPFHPGPSPESSLPYTSKNLRFRAVTPTGGDSLRQKASILAHVLEYMAVINQEMSQVDIVHVRCPAAISLISLFILIFSSSPKYRWIKYAGNWNPSSKEAWSYSLQRWILNKNLPRGVVTVNGTWDKQPEHIYSFFNPCLTVEEHAIGKKLAQKKELKPPYRIAFVGRLDSDKGVGRILEISGKLHQAGLPFQLDLVGDGPEREKFVRQASDLKISDMTHFHGWLPRPSLISIYSEAHFLIFPSSSSEGWPKVLSEAMAFGAVPISSNVSCIPQILQEVHAGLAFPPEEIDRYVHAILGFTENPSMWKLVSMAAADAAENFTYDRYLKKVEAMLHSLIQKEIPYDR